jgi:phosphate transport system ATP-binding protein
MRIQEHTITSISGPSGIGKTSLLLMFNQMIQEEEHVKIKGEILFKDEDRVIDLNTLPKKSLPELRKKIVYVNQNPDLLPFSIYENVAFGLHLQNVSQSETKIRVEQALKDVLLWDEVKERLQAHATMLSGGQQQRLILARALAIKPKILLLDEPTASLNEALALKIEAFLISLKNHMTIITISHFKDQIKRISDQNIDFEQFVTQD